MVAAKRSANTVVLARIEYAVTEDQMSQTISERPKAISSDVLPGNLPIDPAFLQLGIELLSSGASKPLVEGELESLLG